MLEDVINSIPGIRYREFLFYKRAYIFALYNF
jgi:hypothetical protein